MHLTDAVTPTRTETGFFEHQDVVDHPPAVAEESADRVAAPLMNLVTAVGFLHLRWLDDDSLHFAKDIEFIGVTLLPTS